MAGLRTPAVAGSFYPRDPAVLRADIDRLLAEAPARQGVLPKAVIVPHAGYVYSGPTAAAAYKALAPGRDIYRRVVLLGPAHRVALRGLALPAADSFATPLGEIAVDTALAGRLRGLPQVSINAPAHAPEHSLEVQLPFLQRVLSDFTLLPLVVGDASPAEVAAVLQAVWGGPETLIVISSDLSHFLPYAEAQRADRATVAEILQGEATLGHEEACGATPVNGLMLALRDLDLEAVLIDLRNSGDTAGDRERVVGYASLLFEPREPGLEARLGDTLLQLARASITDAVGGLADWPPPCAALDEPGATFITLTRNGRLRGCIGSLEARRSLRLDVIENAKAAALRDPRFPPLHADELAAVKLEVSLLSAPVVLPVADEAAGWAAVRPGVHGVILEYRGRRATFLPQVWEQLPSARDFFAHLKEKAGLAADFWSGEITLSRYTVQKWRER